MFKRTVGLLMGSLLLLPFAPNAGASDDLNSSAAGPPAPVVVQSEAEHDVLQESLSVRASFGLRSDRPFVESIVAQAGLAIDDQAALAELVNEWGFIGTEDEAASIERREVVMPAVRMDAPSLFAEPTYAGSYFDGSILVIQYAGTHLPEDVLPIGSRGGRDWSATDVRFDTVAHSSAKLTALQKSIMEYEYGDRTWASVVMEDPKINGLDITLDPRTPEVVERRVLDLLAETEVEFRIRRDDTYPDACSSRTSCGSPQRAGVQINYGTACSSGWVVNRNGSRGVLTAGHCWPSATSGTVTAGGETFGNLTSVTAYYGGSHADIRYLSAPDTRAWIYRSSATKAQVVAGTSSPFVGGTACLYGKNSESARCAAITSTNVAVKYGSGPQLYGLVAAPYSSTITTSGDSGGAVANTTTGNYARGVHSGGNSSTKFFSSIGYLSTYGLGSVATG